MAKEELMFYATGTAGIDGRELLVLCVTPAGVEALRTGATVHLSQLPATLNNVGHIVVAPVRSRQRLKEIGQMMGITIGEVQ